MLANLGFCQSSEIREPHLDLREGNTARPDEVLDSVGGAPAESGVVGRDSAGAATADPYGTVVGATVAHFCGDRDQKRSGEERGQL